MKIIAFTGMPFSGKSEAVKIAKEQNIPVIRMGDMIWEETKRQGLELNDENVGRIANNMRKKYSMDIWAKRTFEKIQEMNDVDVLVIDGVRNGEEIDFFKEKLGKDFVVVAVEVPDETRHKRAMNRDREDDSADINKIKERDQREINWGLDKVIKSADIKISNEGTVDDFYKKIKEIFSNL